MVRSLWVRGRYWVAAAGFAVGCGQSKSLSGFGATGDDGGESDAGLAEGGNGGDDGGGGQFGGSSGIAPTGPVTDFPSPVLDGSAPTNSGSLFGAAGSGAASGGPCLVEPEVNVLYPQNWLAPRFRWTAAGAQNLFELRLHVANQTSDLVVYSTNTSWTMPVDTWNALRLHSAGQAMTITVRGGNLEGSSLQGIAVGSQAPMGVAPVAATGAIVYWTTNDATTGGSVLKGFSPGDSTVGTVLMPTQFATAQQTGSTCIGCHASSPDGEFAAFTYTNSAAQQWQGGIALIDNEAGTVGAAPSFMNAAGTTSLERYNAGGLAFSPAHWAPGDRTTISSFDNSGNAQNIGLTWVNLDATTLATTTGTIARTGDSQLAGAPSWSHDGNTVAYVSTNRVCTGRLGNCNGTAFDQPPDPGSTADIYTVPYAGGQGGQATPLPGASDESNQEYYPAYSADDKLIAFNRIGPNLNLYAQPAAEVFVIASAGGTATRLAANDPPACTGITSPGINNVWPKWGPAALSAGGDTYYFLIFSSLRYDKHTDQLFITAVVRHADGTMVTNYGAIYLWNQPPTENNHTPAWDKFKVPALPMVQ